MKRGRKLMAVLLTAVLVYTLTGCSLASVKDSWKLLLGKSENGSMTTAEIQELKDNKVVRIVDENLAAPEFTLNLGDTFTYQVGAGSEYTFTFQKI